MKNLVIVSPTLVKLLIGMFFAFFFRLLLESMYANKSDKGGHPNVDVILMFKIQLLEVWYNLSGLAVEREIFDRLSFWYLE